MPHPLSSRLFALAAAIAADGGEALRRKLGDLVAEEAPFDRGEVVHRGEDGLTRWSLGPAGEDDELAAEDLLRGLWSLAAPLRFDDWAEMASFPATRDLLRGKGLRSLLALPLPSAGGGDAALLIARREGWGFVAASLPALLPLAEIAGVALARSLAITALHRRAEALEAGLSAGGGDRSTLRRELVAARSEAETLRRELGGLRERLAAEEARIRGLGEQLQEAGAARDALRVESLAAAAAASGARDEAMARLRDQELKAAELEVRVEELSGSRESLVAELGRVRGDLAERDAEVRLLREQMRSLREEPAASRSQGAGPDPIGTLAELDRRREDAAGLEAEVLALRGALDSARDEAGRERTEREHARSALADAEARRCAFERALRQAEEEREALRAELERRDAAVPPRPSSPRRPRARRRPPGSRPRAGPRGPERHGGALRRRSGGATPGRRGRR